MPQPFLHHCEQFGIVACLGIDQALGIEPHLREPGREQIPPPHHPQNRSPGARRDPGEKQGRGAIIGHIAGAACDLMQRIEPQPAIGKPRIDRADTERQRRAATETLGLHRAQLLAKLGKDGRIGHKAAAVTHDSGTAMFLFCSALPESQSIVCQTLALRRVAPLG